MRTRLRAHLTYANAMASVAVFIALSAGAYAATGGALVASSGVIKGCVPKHGGSLRVLPAGKKCPKGQVTLPFNQRGSAGAAGINGINGTNGTTGISGTNGTNGTNGLTGYQVVSAVSTTAANNYKQLVATCPAGDTAIAGGGYYAASTAPAPIDTASSYPTLNGGAVSAGAKPDGWLFAANTQGLTNLAGWDITTYAICAHIT
jgi:hypothetical protein